MKTIIVIAVVVNLILSFLVANMGSKRQLGSVGAFFLSFLFSPILGMLFVIASERLTVKEIAKKGEFFVDMYIPIIATILTIVTVVTVITINS